MLFLFLSRSMLEQTFCWCLFFKHSQGKKMPFIFIRVKNSQKYFALNVPKLKGRYDLTDSKLHHYQVSIKTLRNQAFFTVPCL